MSKPSELYACIHATAGRFFALLLHRADLMQGEWHMAALYD